MPRLHSIAIVGVVAALFAVAMPALGQENRAGIGVDARGGAVIDPTENVKALNAAEAKRQDDLRGMEAKFQNAMREKEAEISKVARDAETRRINELSAQKQLFDLELARVLRSNVDAASLLLATQLKEVKTDISERMTKQEQFRWESGGRSDTIAWIIVFIATLAAVAGPIVTIMVMRPKHTA